MWNNTQMALRDRLSDLSLEQKRALCALILSDTRTAQGGIEVIDAQLSAEQIVNLLSNASDDCKEMLKRLLGSCGATGCNHKTGAAGCYNRRMSVLEEERLRSDIGGAIDIPTVAGAGGVQTVTVPAYNLEYWLEQFSMDGEISVATGSLSRVEVVLSHAGFPLATFRASQYYKATCCTTIADAFRKKGLCLGWGSTLTLVVTNNNALAGETFVNGVFSYIRGYPDPM